MLFFSDGLDFFFQDRRSLGTFFFGNKVDKIFK